MLPPAHETWFVHHPEDYPLDWSALLRTSVLVGLAVVVIVACAWRLGSRLLPVPELRQLQRLGHFAEWVPRLLGVHLGVSLLLLAVQRAVLDPSVIVSGGLPGTLLLLPEVVVAACFIAGRQVVLAACAVVAAGPVLVVLAGPRALLSCAVLVGIAGFLMVVPPQPCLGGRADLSSALLRPAVLMLRVGTAGTLITLAVVEKLANPAMARAMLTQVPGLDILSPLGLGHDGFAVLAGCVEVLFGLLVLSGATPQLVALVAAVPFTATLAVFGGTELIGHLPVYGVLLSLLLLGSRATTSREVSHLPALRVHS